MALIFHHGLTKGGQVLASREERERERDGERERERERERDETRVPLGLAEAEGKFLMFGESANLG